ncbi:hypothetical protein [Ruminococcus sp.]|uniref:DUF7601 domain-containing protein n=1 Tax=Ruminococcus sp. TaxID=41978 RepID=UPI0025E5C3F9|nr:hypothetical protein [Ruminococcus sp.]MBQ8966612.1 hypothetical protein [Ruminococcus sp.]
MKKNKFFAGLAASVLAAGMMTAVSASATAAEPLDNYEIINGTQVSFDKYLVMENSATVPNVSFGFSVAPAEEDIPATENTLGVKKGPAGIKFVADEDNDVTVNTDGNAQAAFKSSDTTEAEADAENRTIKFDTDIEDDEKFASKAVTLDLSEVEFTEPDVYRYVVTEQKAEGIAGVTSDADNVRYLDVYVIDKDGELKIDGFYFHTGSDAPKVGTPDSSRKSTGFSNAYRTNDLAFSKTVTGNQGSKDKYFKFTLTLTNADGLDVNDDDVFMLKGSWDKEPEVNDATIYTAEELASNKKTSLTYAELKAGYDIYLHSGQNITVQGIPEGLGYVVKEAFEDYAPSVVLSNSSDMQTADKEDEGTAIEGKTEGTEFSVTDTYLTKNTEAAFTNDRAGTLPTGIIVAVAVPVVLSIAGFAGAMTIFIKRRKEDAEG